MTNRSQAKPTRDPKDPIQRQSLVGPAFLSAAACLLSIVWLVYDDFVATKPWKAYQDNFQSVAASFLAEQMWEARVAVDGLPEAVKKGSEDIAKLRSDEFEAKLKAIDTSIKEIEDEIIAVDGKIGDGFWKKEQASMLTAQKYQIEHHKDHKLDQYRAHLDEVNTRIELVSRMKLYVERLKARKPDLDSGITMLQQKLGAPLAQLNIVKQNFSSLGEFRKDFVQIYKSHGGSADIVDRCESCHRGTNEPALDRDKMWGSHLSNDTARTFLTKMNPKNYWEFKTARVEKLRMAEEAAGASAAGSFFSRGLDELPTTITGKNVKGLMAVADFQAVQSMLEDGMKKAGAADTVLTAWNASQMWRGNSMLSSKPAAFEPDETLSDEENAEAKKKWVPGVLDPTAGTAKVAKKNKLFNGNFDLSSEDNEGAAKKQVAHGKFAGRATLEVDLELPEFFLVAEAFLWLATDGPYRFDGGMSYPDRFGIGHQPWFQAVVKDPRVLELYQNAYNDYKKHIKENLLMFTAHPRQAATTAKHARDTFGCMSCHRGFGINAKSVESAHGKQVHWLTPMFKEGYQEAGCQKCHKKEIELAGSTQIQQGKSLYYELGCWGCHAYEGYEAESTLKLRAAKDERDTLEAIAKLEPEIAALEAERVRHQSLETGAAMAAAGMPEDAANTESLRLGALAQAKVLEKQRALIALNSKLGDVRTRMDELDREHKKRGPSLKDLYWKVGDDNKGWVANWIRYPKNFRPSTRMPHFFYGPFAMLDEKRIEAAGGDAATAFEPGHDGDPLYRRFNKQNVDVMKAISTYVWQASKAASDLRDAARPSQHGVLTGDSDEAKQAAADGRLLFSSIGCMGCHSNQPDLVRGSVTLPNYEYTGPRAGTDTLGNYTTTMKVAETWVPAPKYEYRMDGQIARDGHGNPLRNEFVYSTAANLSRVGEKATPDYLVEWILQPQVRNKHAFMPSFFAAIAGTPDGDDRRKLLDTIKSLRSRTDADGRLRLADTMRELGDISQDALKFYRQIVGDAALRARTDDLAITVRTQLEKALEGYEKAKRIASYLMTLKNPALAEKGSTSPESGYIGDYSYEDLVWKAEEGAPEKNEVRNGLGLVMGPKGSFTAETVQVTGFGDFSFMEEGYDDFLASRKAQRSAATLEGLAFAVRDAASSFATTPTDNLRGRLAAALKAFADAYSANADDLSALDGAQASLNKRTDPVSKYSDQNIIKNLREIKADLAGLEALTGVEFTADAGIEAGRQIAHNFAQAAAAMRRVRQIGGDFEATTVAGNGKRFTAYYGCAGCHEIEGMENEGKTGTELTDEGSKFIERLDFGMMGHHAVPSDPHTPEDPRFLTLGSLRPYDPAYQAFGDFVGRTPETLPFVRGGPGLELPEGLRNRYIRSKYDYHSRPAWFQGKLHNPRQWDKGRHLHQESAWFERARMPLFELNEEELMAITAFIEGSENLTPWGAGGDALPAREYIANFNGARDKEVNGWWIMRKYNCVACHSVGEYQGRFRRLADASFGTYLTPEGHAPHGLSLDGMKLTPAATLDDVKNVPPVLFDAGARIRGEWMVDWLRKPYEVRNLTYEAASKITGFSTEGFRSNMRTNLTTGGLVAPAGDGAASDNVLRSQGDTLRTAVQMPHFYLTKGEAVALQQFFSTTAGSPPLTLNTQPRSSESKLEFGERIFLHANCVSCHSITDSVAGSYAYGLSAPNLRQTLDRLSRDWVVRWLRNPQAIQPGTAMKNFFTFNPATNHYELAQTTDLLRPMPTHGYDGDHSEALAAWLFERLPETPFRQLQDKVTAFMKAPAAPK